MSIITLTNDAVKAIRRYSETGLLECLNMSKDSTEFLIKNDHGLSLEAIKTDNINVFEILLDHGLDINKEDEFSNSPLGRSVSDGKYNIVKYLISKGAKLHLRKMLSCFKFSGRYDDVKIFEYIFDQFFLSYIDFSDWIELEKRYKTVLITNFKLFQSVCKLSLLCKICIARKLFPIWKTI